MAKRAILLFASFFTLGMSVPTEASPSDSHNEEMPLFVWAPEDSGLEGRPIFVAAEKTLLPNGEVDPQLLNENAVSWIEQEYLSSDPEEPCRSMHLADDHLNTSEPSWQDFASITADADFIAVVRVTGIRDGFFAHGVGGSLIRLKPMQWLKGHADWQLKYLFIQVGDLQLGNRNFCLSHGQHSTMPEVGDRLVVSYEDKSVNRTYPLIYTSAPNIITLQGNGQASLPPWVRQKHPDWVGKPSASILGEIRRILRSQNGSAQ